MTVIQPRRTSMSSENKLLSIAKLATGVIIAAILFSFGIPGFMDHNQQSEIALKIGKDVSILYDNLQIAKNTAIKTKHRVWVQFLGTHGYTIFEDINGNGVFDTDEPMRKIDLSPENQFGINFKQPIQNVWGSGTVSQPIEFIGGNKMIYFKPNGKASSSGAVYFISKAEFGKDEADVRALKIVGANGKITVLKISRDYSPPWK
ncbi:MAG TPA: GspH/FimT family protein [Cyclobacteriaceae bacterium]